MALERTLLDTTRLGPQAQAALLPGPMRMMAASGLAPLASPRDLISVLYQLSLDSDAAIARAAATSARDLPDRVLEGALADDSVDPRVLDYFADLVLDRPALLHRIILNRATADETIAALAGRTGAAEVDLIAQNEQRMLRHPAIIAAMFQNPRGRMSTVDRAIELAARNQVAVPDIPSWDALAAAALGQAREPQAGAPSDQEKDALFAQVAEAVASRSDEDADRVASDPGAPGDSPSPAPARESSAKIPPLHTLTVPMKIRLATMGNAFARAMLVRDPNRVVATAAIKAPGVTDAEAAKYAGNQSLSDDVIKYIVSRRDWVKSYSVKVSLVHNPKTPIPEAIRLMPHLRERDLQFITRSKNVPSAVAAQARKLLLARRSSDKK